MEFLNNITIEQMLQVYLICIISDFITGTFAAKINNEYKSSIARKGIWTTALEIFMVIVMTMLIKIVPEIKSFEMTLIAFLVYKEYRSICENLRKANINIPEWMIKGLADEDKKIDK